MSKVWYGAPRNCVDVSFKDNENSVAYRERKREETLWKKINEKRVKDGLNANEILLVIETMCNQVKASWNLLPIPSSVKLGVDFSNGFISVEHGRTVEMIWIYLYDTGSKGQIDELQVGVVLQGEEYVKLSKGLKNLEDYASICAAARRVGKGVM